MSDRPLATGKLPPELLGELLADAPALPSEVLLGPRVGEDACAIALPGGVLIAATDPITLTGTGVGAHSVVVNANDVAVMGVRPRWFLAAVMLPDGTRESAVRALFAGMRSACERAGVALVGGHSEVTAAVVQPVVVGQMLGLAEDGRFVRTGGMRPGDVVVQVGPAPVEGAAVLAVEAPVGGGAETARPLAEVDPALVERARGALEEPGISVVEAALECAARGATALHDPTEGGLASGLHELAGASQVALVVDPEAVVWFEPGLAVCRALGADPWGVLASGALLAGFPDECAGSALEALGERGWAARAIARARGAADGPAVALADGSALARFDRDEVARVLASHPRPGTG